MKYDPDAHVTITCAKCGKEVERRRKDNRKYCSRECWKSDKATEARMTGGKLTTKCPTCAKEFEYDRSWPRKYCSIACRAVSQRNGTSPRVYKRYETTCEQCGKTYVVKPSANKGRFCSLACHGKWMSVNLVGDAHPRKGTKQGRPPYLPPPSMLNCIACGQPFVVKPRELKIRKCCSKSCQAIHYQTAQAGENNPVWTGGYEPYYGPSWRPAQRATRERDGKCLDCGATPEELGYQLAVHHVIPFSIFGVARHEEANQLSNLQSLCSPCHGKRRKQDHLIRKQIKTGSLFPDLK